jgi:hypothetical protein
MKVSGTFSGAELDVIFSATAEPSDFGPGTPEFNEIIDIEITAISILGVEVPLSFPSAELKKAILALACEVEFE